MFNAKLTELQDLQEMFGQLHKDDEARVVLLGDDDGLVGLHQPIGLGQRGRQRVQEVVVQGTGFRVGLVTRDRYAGATVEDVYRHDSALGFIDHLFGDFVEVAHWFSFGDVDQKCSQ